MWTHIKPFEPIEPDWGSIDKHGRMALYRALNIKRLVAFVGSGATIAYGRPSWYELVEGLTAYTLEQAEENPCPEVKVIRETLENQLAEDTEVTVKLEICLSLHDAIDRKNRTRVGESRKRFYEKARELIEKKKENNIEKINKISKNSLKKDLCIHKEITDRYNLNSPLFYLIEKLNIKKFITTNYDFEIEKYFQSKLGYNEPKNVLFPERDSQERNREKENRINRRLARNGFGSLCSSSILTRETIDDLINFAVGHERREVQILHIHGRCDQPESLILSEMDYQERYLKPASERYNSPRRSAELDKSSHIDFPRRSFRDGMDALFGGNAVLFVGIGMNEQELLRPLSRFVAEARGVPAEDRQIIALLESKGPKEDNKRSIMLYQKYQVYCVFFGLRERSKDKKFGNAENDDWLNDIGSKIKKLACALRKEKTPLYELRDKARELKSCGGFKALLTETLVRDVRIPNNEELECKIRKEIKHLGELEVRIIEKLLNCIMETFLYKKGSRDEIAECLSSISSGIKTRALCLKLFNIHEGQLKWWADWSYDQKPRRAIFREHQSNAKKPTLWIRHRPKYHKDLDKDVYKNLYDEVKKISIRQLGPNRHARRQIIRLTSERGSGKGVLVGLVQNNYEDFLAYPSKNVMYTGAFFAGSSFSSEYTSVIKGFTRFLFGRVIADCLEKNGFNPKLKEEVASEFVKKVGEKNFCHVKDKFKNINLEHIEQYYNETEKNFENIGRINLVSSLMRDFQIKTNGSKRVFVCLSSLDRLCDRFGRPYNPTIRSFFRLLRSRDHENMPMDLVLISGDPEHPILHLSERSMQNRWNESPSTSNAIQRDTSEGTMLVSMPALERGQQNTSSVTFQRTDPHLLAQYEYVAQRESFRPKLWSKFEPPELKGRCFNNDDLHRPTSRWLSILEGKEFQHLKKGIKQSLVLHCLIEKAFNNPGKCKEDETLWLNLLDTAYHQGGFNSTLRVLFDYYRQIDQEPEKTHRHREILRHLMLFHLPVEFEVLLACPMLIESYDKGGCLDRRQLEEDLEVLENRSLILAVFTSAFDGSDQSKAKRYTIQNQVREHIADRMDFPLMDKGERNFWDASLYAHQPTDLPTPGQKDFELIGGILKELIQTSKNDLKYYYRYKEEKIFNNQVEIKNISTLSEICNKLRAAFSLVQGAFSIGVLSRLVDYDLGDGFDGEGTAPYNQHRGWIRGLTNAAIGVDYTRPDDPVVECGESECVNKQKNKYWVTRRVLYHDEIIWLYNERGLVSFTQGRLFDAQPLFEHALRLANKVDAPVKTSVADIYDDGSLSAARRIELNLALCILERGKITRARRIFERIDERSRAEVNRYGSITGALARGYLGLCDHLGGQVESAKNRYKEIIDHAEENSWMRVLSIFNRHMADLARLDKDNDRALCHIRAASQAAARGEQRDVMYLAFISEARLELEFPAKKQALSLLDQAEDYADKNGLPKLKLEALALRAEWMLKHGDLDIAGRLAARSAGISQMHGMRLRRINALIILSKVISGRGRKEIARQLLRKACDAAERSGYQLKAGIARRETGLQQLN